MEISKIVEQNPWWKFGGNFVYHDRTMNQYHAAEVKFERRKIRLLPSNIYVLHGPRQVGKTTEIKKTTLELIQSGIDPESICYFSCEDLTSARELGKVLDFFLARLERYEKIYLFLDEINFVKDWVPQIKRAAESRAFNRVIFVVTGSPFGLKIHTHELVGRGIEGNRHFIKPLSFRDFVLQICKSMARKTPEPSLRDELEILSNRLPNVCIDLEGSMEEVAKKVEELLKYIRSLNFLFKVYLLTGGFPAVINDYLKNLKGRKLEPACTRCLWN